jgi:hypothetical protein
MDCKVAYTGSNSILVPNFMAEHVPDGFLISEWDFISLLDELQSCIADEFEAYNLVLVP